MNKAVIALVAAVVGLSASHVRAKDYSKVHTYGPGAFSCGKWLDARRQTPETITEANMTTWMLGFITAAQVYSDSDLKDGDVYAFQAEMDNLCKARPLEPFATAVTRLANELGAKQPR